MTLARWVGENMRTRFGGLTVSGCQQQVLGLPRTRWTVGLQDSLRMIGEIGTEMPVRASTRTTRKSTTKSHRRRRVSTRSGLGLPQGGRCD